MYSSCNEAYILLRARHCTYLSLCVRFLNQNISHVQFIHISLNSIKLIFNGVISMVAQTLCVILNSRPPKPSQTVTYTWALKPNSIIVLSCHPSPTTHGHPNNHHRFATIQIPSQKPKPKFNNPQPPKQPPQICDSLR